MSDPIEIRIKTTHVPQRGLFAVTAKLTDPSAAQPYETFSICDLSGYASAIAYFETEAAALRAHDELVASLNRERRELPDMPW